MIFDSDTAKCFPFAGSSEHSCESASRSAGKYPLTHCKSCSFGGLIVKISRPAQSTNKEQAEAKVEIFTNVKVSVQSTGSAIVQLIRNVK